MPHPLVTQLRFTRSEFNRGIKNINQEDAIIRILPMNCMSWNVGHLAWQEQRYFLKYGMGQILFPEIDDAFAYGAPGSTPPLQEVLTAWKTITETADPWLDTLTNDSLVSRIISRGKEIQYTFGKLLLRTIYHYWYHLGENMAIRQQLGHTELPQFVGAIDKKAPYTPEF
jgi:hypothetical protein